MSTHPIAIIGGGPVGLTASILLSLRGIPHVLYERHAGTSIHPKACGINQRTTEVYRSMGIYDAVRAAACPDDVKGRTAWYTSLGGAGPVDARELWARDAWGEGAYAAEYATQSPARYEIIPQIRLEPILLARARELNPDGIFFGREVTDVVPAADHVDLRVVSRSGETETETVRARYVIAADGGRGVTDKLGIKWEGERDIMHMVSVHFHARLRQHHPDPRNFITWFTHPAKGGSIRTGFLYQIGPWPLTADGPEEWVFACAPGADDPARSDPAAMVALLRDTLKFPAAEPVKVISLSPWSVNAINAENYSAGRVYLAGDAAHRIPPWGALGMNTGAQDAQNLVWKLSLALADDARFAPLLASYDAERRPIGRRVGLFSLHNLRSHGLCMDAALNMSPAKTVDENTAGLMAFLDATHVDHARTKQAVHEAQARLDSEFKAPGAEIGWFYPGLDQTGAAAASRHDGQLTEAGELDFSRYVPTTLPGHHLPHTWVQRASGADKTVTAAGGKTALRDLVPLSKLLLIGRDARWKALAGELVHVETLGDADAEWVDISGRWADIIGDIDGLLVRPDGIIAWRGKWADDLAAGEWTKIVNQALYIDA